MNLQDLVTVGPSETIPGIPAVSTARLDVAAIEVNHGTIYCQRFLPAMTMLWCQRIWYWWINVWNVERGFVDCSQQNNKERMYQH